MTVDIFTAACSLASMCFHRGNKVDAFGFPRILSNPCFRNKRAAFRYYLRHQWRGIRLRIEQTSGSIFDLLTLAMVIGGAILF